MIGERGRGHTCVSAGLSAAELPRWHFGLENTAGGHLVQRSAFRQGNSGSWKFVTNRVKADKEMDDFLLEPSLLSIQVIVTH